MQFFSCFDGFHTVNVTYFLLNNSGISFFRQSGGGTLANAGLNYCSKSASTNVDKDFK